MHKRPWHSVHHEDALRACLFAPASLKLSTVISHGVSLHNLRKASFSRKGCAHKQKGAGLSFCKSSKSGHQNCGDLHHKLAKQIQSNSLQQDIVQRALGLFASAVLAFSSTFSLLPPSSQARQSGGEPQIENARANTASSIEESLASLARTFEAKLDSAVGLVADFGFPGAKQDESKISEQGKELINEVWEVIARKYVDVRSGGFDKQKWAQLKDEALAKPLKDKGSVERAIRTMIADGISDRFTRYITADQFAKMQSYDITGVGLNLCTASELEEKTDFQASQPGLYVLGLINQSPASRAGVAQGDQILEIDGVPVRNETPFQAASLIQGPEDESRNPTVILKVRHGGSSDVRDFSLQRPVVDTSSPVQAKLINVAGRKMGHIRVEKFVARTQPDVAAAVTKLGNQGAQEFVLDLRDNLGGLVEEGVEVARLFLNGNVTIVNRLDSGGIRPRTTTGSRALTQAPLMLLVNERTASASEILAGALRDNCRAVLVGQRTYGKGLIQSVYQLEDGSALAVTIGKYLTPAKTDIDREGIKPDFGTIPDQNLAANVLSSCRIPELAL